MEKRAKMLPRVAPEVVLPLAEAHLLRDGKEGSFQGRYVMMRQVGAMVWLTEDVMTALGVVRKAKERLYVVGIALEERGCFDYPYGIVDADGFFLTGEEVAIIAR